MLLLGAGLSWSVLSALGHAQQHVPKVMEHVMWLPLVLAMYGVLMLVTGRSPTTINRDFRAGSPPLVAAMVVMAILILAGIPCLIWNMGPPLILPTPSSQEQMDAAQAAIPVHMLHLHPLPQTDAADRTTSPADTSADHGAVPDPEHPIAAHP